MMDWVRHDTDDGAAFVVGTDDKTLEQRIKQAANRGDTTPQPDPDDYNDSGGPISRVSDTFSPFSAGLLEHIGLSSHEIANAIRTRIQELYHAEFPVVKARFERTCTECAAEYQTQTETCDHCDADTRPPDAAEKRRAEKLLESVNKEGQSLRDLAREAEQDNWLHGVPVLVLRQRYALSEQATDLPGRKRIIESEPEELIKGDPQTIVPVVDGNRRIGGHWWACPGCRNTDSYSPEKEPGYCEGCGSKLREVYFAELSSSGQTPDALFFEEEILTYPYPIPRLHGLDGISPVAHVWLKQMIIEMQDSYAAAFYDPESDRLPNQFMILHTTNPDKWEEQLKQARENAKDDKYDSPIFANQFSPQNNSPPEVQVVDAMPDELLGQNQDLRRQFKKDIRQAMGVADVHDSDLEDAGGLNNEGMQLEVTDRSIADQQATYVQGWLDDFAKRLDISDHYIDFHHEQGVDAADLQDELRAGMLAEQAGLDATLEDEQVTVADGEFDPQEQPRPDETADPSDTLDHDFGPMPSTQKAYDRREYALDTLERAHKHLTWPELVEQKAAEPFFADDEDVPKFVRQLIEEAIRNGAIETISDALPNRVRKQDVEQFFREKLTQPQGWSLRSLTKDYANRFDVDPDDAVTAIRTQVTQVMGEAREEGFRQQGDLDERRFKVIGPIDGEKTEASWELLERTNPEYADRNEYTSPGEGGEPRSLDELKALFNFVRTKHFPEFNGGTFVAHWNERDSVVEHFE